MLQDLCICALVMIVDIMGKIKEKRQFLICKIFVE